MSESYVGPMFLVPKVELITRKSVRCCPGSPCGILPKKQDAKFCEACGQPVTTMVLETKEMCYPHPDDISDDGQWGDVVSQFSVGKSLGMDVWLPNKHHFGVNLEVESDSSLVVLIEAEMRESTSQFKQKYGDLAEAFKTKFGMELLVTYAAVTYDY